jgi:HEAT repeat protein
MDDIAPLIADLNHDSLSVALAAAEQLGQVGDATALQALKDRFAPYRFMGSNHEENLFYFTIALILAELGSYHEYSYAVNEDAPFVRPRVAKLLKQLGKARAIKAAEAMLQSADDSERYWAKEILAALR